MKKSIIKIVTSSILIVVMLIAIVVLNESVHYNETNEAQLVLQFGKVVSVKTDKGLFFTIPFIQKTKTIYMGENIYDLPVSDVITSDKKTMVADCYSIWKVDEPLKFYQTVANESVAESRLNVSIYNSLKNVISSTSQMDVISGKDGSLGNAIKKNVKLSNQYGINMVEIETKLLDLPNENKADVYKRMISERNAIAAQYKAEGDKTYQTQVAKTDAEVRQIKSDAEVEAAKTEAEAEENYYQTLSNAYSSTKEREEFYNYMIALETLEKSMQKGGTVQIDKDSPLYDVLINVQKSE